VNAIEIIRQCRDAGIRLQARGDRLHVEAPTGALTAELREQLTDNKADILALHSIRGRLHEVAKSLGIPRAVVDGLPAEDLAATAQQAQACEGHLDRDGNPLARSLLMFYLQTLAEQTTVRAS
jgi:hypothetical protein